MKRRRPASMKFCPGIIALLLVFSLVVQPVAGYAGSNARLVPSGKVSVLHGGKEVSRFRSEMPLPQGILMACNGNCVVQSRDVQMVVHDKAVFALIEDNGQWDLTVNSGRVDFAVRTEGKPISFHTPHDLVQTQRMIVPAGSEGLLRGHIIVEAKTTELGVDQGAMQVLSRNGVDLIQEGHSIVLAQAEMSASPREDGKDARPDAGGFPLSAASAVAGPDMSTIWIAGLTALGILGGAVALSADTHGRPVSPQ
ncbi:hypothetical protein Sfum_3320 [Syntrophobacter fumaroxidans MPOB]|uniref:FecR protein domain-containing protein n=2 Tax=Syntrophobacter TaxID=29526 RepID=A0LNJ1_SYNFM|nr:hypothetical protein Sfum_3320 [Syntrophobacter fumaroxidans MPOB]